MGVISHMGVFNLYVFNSLIFSSLKSFFKVHLFSIILFLFFFYPSQASENFQIQVLKTLPVPFCSRLEGILDLYLTKLPASPIKRFARRCCSWSYHRHEPRFVDWSRRYRWICFWKGNHGQTEWLIHANSLRQTIQQRYRCDSEWFGSQKESIWNHRAAEAFRFIDGN